MKYFSKYQSPLGPITMASDGDAITGLWFDGQKYDRASLQEDAVELVEDRLVFSEDKMVLATGTGGQFEKDQASLSYVFRKARSWLDQYFAGEKPEAIGERPPLAFVGSDFQKEVWKLLLEIPYGKTTSYGELAKKLAEKKGLKTMSAQAVGGAVGHNKISILVPCHRVVGADGKLTGYAGGIERKKWMLEMEKK